MRRSADEREQRWAEEHQEQRRQDAEGEREEHEDREATRARLRAVTFGRADRVGLEHEKPRERRAEPHRRDDERRDAGFVRPARERRERIAQRPAEREVREESTRIRVARRE